MTTTKTETMFEIDCVHPYLGSDHYSAHLYEDEARALLRVKIAEQPELSWQLWERISHDTRKLLTQYIGEVDDGKYGDWRDEIVPPYAP